jgi:D-threo-aldose 1-dehydrogenase
MRSNTLGQTGIEVSHLGFGCVKLTTHPERRDAVRILEHAFAHGITHFDVARAYGFGRAEGILGDFLRDKRPRVTVATKFGIQPPSGIAGNRWIIDVAKKILGPFPSLLRHAKHRGSAMVRSGVFTPVMAIRSLETSLRELHTDYVDLLLLHEATLADAASKPLIDALQEQVTRGTVRAFGVASDFQKLGEDADRVPSSYQILQLEDNAHARNLRTLRHGTRRGAITHSVFQPALPLQSAVSLQSECVRRFSSEINADLGDQMVIGSLLLHYALQSNRKGVVLFSSSNPQRVSANVRDAESGRYDERQLLRFVEFVDTLLNSNSLPNTPRSISPQAAS